MHRFWEYFLFFAALLLLQVLLFDNLNLSIYVTPLVYVAFLVMLPLNIGPGVLLLAGLLTGAIMDFFMGTGGINTIASLATAFIRPWAAGVTLGKDADRENETPSPRGHGRVKWLRYVTLLTGIHCLIFFLFEALSLRYIGFTLLRTVCSAAATILVVWFIGIIYPSRR